VDLTAYFHNDLSSGVRMQGDSGVRMQGDSGVRMQGDSGGFF
jgi:hypothetical protein